MFMQFPSYSIAIRTLGRAGQLYQNLLDSLLIQTVKPEKIVIYLAEGYSLPQETIGVEEYVYVQKGMVAQRALPFTEITSEYILMLDDDACLQPDSVEKLLKGLMEDSEAKCIAANSFANHLWPPVEKIKFAVFGTTPRKNDEYAFKVKNNITYSYNNSPARNVLKTESFAGMAFLIHTETLRRVSFKDEIWMDEFGYAMGDDLLLSYKLYVNGNSLLVHYNSGIIHQDAKSGHLDADFAKKLMKSTTVLFVLWHRVRIAQAPLFLKLFYGICYTLSVIWKTIIYSLVSIYRLDRHIVMAYVKGIIAGIRYTRTSKYKSIPPFILDK